MSVDASLNEEPVARPHAHCDVIRLATWQGGIRENDVICKILLKYWTEVPLDKARMKYLLQIEGNNRVAGTGNSHAAAMAETPDLRADKIARGKALIADPNYPSTEQIRKIADLLAAKLGRAASESPNRLSASAPCGFSSPRH